jgi:hypothetical protein
MFARALTLSLALVSLAHAAPGDPVALRGTLAWPPALGGERFAVVRSDDGRFFYADLTAAQRGGPIAGGARLSVLGVEGARPHEVAAVAIGPGDSVLAPPSDQPSASPPTDAAAPASPPPAPARPEDGRPPERRPEDSRPPERIEGTLESVSDRLLTIRSNGRAVKVDVSKLGANTLQGVKAGDRVTVFAVSEPGRPLTAVGFVHSSGQPAPRR